MVKKIFTILISKLLSLWTYVKLLPLISFREAQYTLSNLLFAVLVVGLVFLGLYILWRWCSDEQPDQNTKKDKCLMQSVYAHEIEPGLFVLQSEGGEYFKILREYDGSKRNAYGSLIGSPGSQQSLLQHSDSGTQLLTESHLTQAHIHTPASASAPPLIGGLSGESQRFGEMVGPPSYAAVQLHVGEY